MKIYTIQVTGKNHVTHPIYVKSVKKNTKRININCNHEVQDSGSLLNAPNGFQEQKIWPMLLKTEKVSDINYS